MKLIIAIIELGQFGLDQLLEAPTPKLISFIHCNYWSQNVAGLTDYNMFGGGIITVLESAITFNEL